MAQLEARGAHNPEVTRSKRVAATTRIFCRFLTTSPIAKFVTATSFIISLHSNPVSDSNNLLCLRNMAGVETNISSRGGSTAPSPKSQVFLMKDPQNQETD